MWFKKLTIPKTNEVKQIETVQTWEVRWQSRYGDFRTDTQPEIEAFLSKEEAEAFAESLKAAQRLLRNTSPINVEIKKGKKYKPNQC